MGLSVEQGFKFDARRSNDSRDWDEIRSFARRFAETLRK